LSKWNALFSELRSVGQFLIKNDLNGDKKVSLMNVESLPQWQTGAAMWWASEMLTLLNFFFPIDKMQEKKALREKIEILKQRKVGNEKVKRFKIAVS
jgi:hypothetical protein